MGWFNVLKGAYPSLQQIDQVLDVSSTATGLTRGTLMYVDVTGPNAVYSVAGAAQSLIAGAYLFFALIPQDNLTAGMAGTMGLEADIDQTGVHGDGLKAGVARVNGLAVGMPMEFETTEYVTDSYDVGQLLTVANGGKLTKLTPDGNTNCVAIVTRPVHSKWVNNAIAVTGRRTGANVNVLTARTLWVPLMAA